MSGKSRLLPQRARELEKARPACREKQADRTFASGRRPTVRKGATHCYNERGDPAGSRRRDRTVSGGIRPRLGYHLRVAEKPGDEPNRTTADQAGSFR